MQNIISKQVVIELILLFLILAGSALLRLPHLGYSHFYGDEIKTLYLDKTVSASQFLLDQRKGPAQFMVSWSMEKLTGGYSEFWIRLPFAVAGVFSVLAFYLFCRKVFGWQAALTSTALFGVCGFYVAFARTAQYQSFLFLFGFTFLYLFVWALEKRSGLLFGLSSLAFALALLSHYDALFMALPALFFLFHHLQSFSDPKSKKTIILKTLLSFVLPLAIFLSVFFIPYVAKGYFFENTYNYLLRRVSGKELLPNNSLYTFFVYNHSILAFVAPLISLVGLFFVKNFRQKIFFLWFFITFFILEFLMQNPGTHINNYFLPLYAVSGYIILRIINFIKSLPVKVLAFACLISVIGVLGYTSATSFLPIFNNGYPYVAGQVATRYQLYLYGFPYNVGWDQIHSHFSSKNRVAGVFTNDDDDIAMYYLRGIPYTRPGSNFFPAYYIHIENDLQLGTVGFNKIKNFDFLYSLEKEIFVNGKLSAKIYKKN